MRSKKTKHAARTPLQIILTVVIAVLAVSVTVIGLYAVAEIRKSSSPYRYNYDAGDYRYSLLNGRYGDLLETADDDSVLGTVYSSEVAEYRAVAHYYEAALLFRAYRDAGETEEARRQEERMLTFAESAGSLSDEIVRINETLGL